MIEKAPKKTQNFPSWFRPLAFIVVETFLWTTLSFDIALALDSHTQNLLRPKQATQSSLGKELQFDLTGGESSSPVSTPQTAPLVTAQLPIPPVATLPTAQDGGGKPFRGKLPSLSFLSQTVSGPEFDILRMAISPLNIPGEVAMPSEADIQTFFAYVKAVGFDALMQIQNVSARLPVEASRRELLIHSISSLREKITPLLEHVETPPVGLSDILSSGTERLDETLRAGFSNAFAKASGVRGSPEAKLRLIRAHLIHLSDPSKERLLNILELISKLDTPQAKQGAIAAFVGRYLFSVENALQLGRIFNGKVKLLIGTSDTLQFMFVSSVGMAAPRETIDMLIDALENNRIGLTSVAFEIAHWSASLLSNLPMSSRGEKDRRMPSPSAEERTCRTPFRTPSLVQAVRAGSHKPWNG